MPKAEGLCYTIFTMKRFLRVALPVALVLVPVAVSAITILPPCTATGDCGVTDILAVLVNVAEYLLGISGAVALAMFVYGGFTFVLAAGDKTKVGKAIGILKSAVIGIAIIFLSGVIVRFATKALTGGSSAIPTVGENCDPISKKSASGGAGLWISVPPGVDDNGKLLPEQLMCIHKKGGCAELQGVLTSRHRLEKYSCKAINTAASCVRSLCPEQGADYACCL